MTITPLKTITLTPREELISDIMMILDEAIIGDEPVGVHELAERIVEAMEGQQAA